MENFCPHFTLCGGCSSQDIIYSQQLKNKEAYIKSLFTCTINPIVASPLPYKYRNKMEFSFSQDKSGNKFLGLLRKRGRVENIHNCFLVDDWFVETLDRVRNWWSSTDLLAYYHPKDYGSLRTLIMRESCRTKEKMIVLTVSGNCDFSLNEKEIKGFINAVGDVDSLILRKQIIKKGKPTYFEEELLSGKKIIYEKMYDSDNKEYTFQIRAASFFQPNTLQSEAIYRHVVDIANLCDEDTLLDLYCGIGTLGIFCSRFVNSVTGVEIVPEAVEDAKENLKLNNIKNMQLFECDVANFSLNNKPRVVIVDPPRPGLQPSVINFLLQLGPEKIIYVSCNPASQARDCQFFESGGYYLQQATPFDQFPHTPHIENVVLLQKS